MSNENSSSFIRNVDLEDEDSHWWISNREIGTIAVNACLAIIHFYKENGVEEIPLRHVSPVHFSAIDELLRGARAAIRSSANIDASLYFGILANDDLSAKVAIELKEKTKENASSICILQTNLKGEQYESHSTVLCEYELVDQRSVPYVMIATYVRDHTCGNDTLVSLIRLLVTGRSAEIFFVYDGTNHDLIGVPDHILQQVQQSIGINQCKRSNDRAKVHGLLENLGRIKKRNSGDHEPKPMISEFNQSNELPDNALNIKNDGGSLAELSAFVDRFSS